MEVIVERFNHFPGATYTEHYPPTVPAPKHFECNCTKHLSKHPGGKPESITLGIKLSDKVDGKDFELTSHMLPDRLDFSISWGDLITLDSEWKKEERRHISFQYEREKAHLQVGILLDPVYFYSYCRDARIRDRDPIADAAYDASYVSFNLCYGQADTTTLLNHHAQSTAITDDQLKPTDLWVHSCTYPDTVEFLEQNEEYADWWTFRTDMHTVMDSLQACLNTPERPLENTHTRCLALTDVIHQQAEFISRIVDSLPETEFFRAGKKCNQDSKDLDRAHRPDRQLD